MKYPIDNSFTGQHIKFVCCSAKAFLLVCALLLSGIVGVAAYRCMPSKYQVSGVMLFDAPDGNVAEEKLQKTFYAVFFDRKQYSGAVLDKTACKVVTQMVDGAAVSDWQAEFNEVKSAEDFLRKLPENIRIFRSYYPGTHIAFSAGNKLLRRRDFKYLMFYCCGWAAAGFLLGGFIGGCFAYLKNFFRHSIGDLRQFSRQYDLPVLGVLPEADKTVYFREAVKALQLKIQFLKPAAARAFVAVVSDFMHGCGAETVASMVVEDLKESGYRVLLLNQSNCNMLAVQGLSQRMETLLAELNNEYDFIVIAAPDIQSSSRSLIIGKLADAVLLICNYHCSPSYPLQVVLWRLIKAKVNVAGCVINNFPLHKKQTEYNLYQLNFRAYKS